MGARGSLVRLLLVVPLLMAVLAVGAPRPAAATQTCTGTLSGTINTGLVVPENASCFVINGVVKGAVTVESGGSLRINSSEIRGSITGSDGGSHLEIEFTNVRGSISANGFGHVWVRGGEVRGDVTITNSFDPEATTQLRGVGLRGNATVSWNTNSAVVVGANTIPGHLYCENNTPLPTTGGFPNEVGLTTNGQCEGFEV